MKSKRIVFLSTLFVALIASTLSIHATNSSLDYNYKVSEVKDTIPAQEVAEDTTIGLVQKKYGDTYEDSVSCRVNTSLYMEYYKQWAAGKYTNDQLLRDALPGWRQVYTLCPRASINIYLRGLRMYKRLIKIEKDSLTREGLIDTVMLIHDQRIAYFSDYKSFNETYILGKKAADLYRYRKLQPQTYYPIYKHVFETSKEKTPPSVMNGYYVATYIYVAKKNAEMPLLFHTYLDIKKALEISIQDTLSKYHKDYIAIDGSLDEKMAKVATCERIENYLGKSYKEDTTNLDVCNLIVYMSNVRRCTDSPLYFRAAKQAYHLDPSPSAAYSMGRLSFQKEKYDEAVHYLTIASENIPDTLANKKAEAYLLLAETYKRQKKYSSLRNAARSASTYRPKDYTAYVLMGDAYARADCQSKGVNTAYWAAYDKYSRALSLVGDDEKAAAKIRTKMGSMKSRFPAGNEIFQRGWTIGQTTKVGCWVGETTTVRESPAVK